MKIIDGIQSAAKEWEIEYVQNLLGVSFPFSFLNCIKQADQGMPELSLFKYLDPESQIIISETTGSFLSFLAKSSNNIAKKFFTREDFRKKKLIPIMDIGSGDYICFDYSIDGFSDKDPPVVLYLLHNSEGKDFVDLAINFQSFLDKLEPEEV